MPKNVEDIRWARAVGRPGIEFAIGNVFHLPFLNYRKDYGKESDRMATRLALSLYKGWDESYPMSGEEPLPWQIAYAIVERTKSYNLLQILAGNSGPLQATYKAMLEIFQYPGAGFMDEAGKILPPLQIGITGNRRCEQYLWAMASVLLDVKDVTQLHLAVPVDIPKNVTEVITVPVGPNGPAVYVFDDQQKPIVGQGSYVDHEKGTKLFIQDSKILDADGKPVKGYKPQEVTLKRFAPDADSQNLRIQVQIRENSTKTAGFLEPSDAENLAAVNIMVKNGATQTDVRKHFQKSVMGLRLFFAVIISMYEISRKMGLRFMERWTAKPYLDSKPGSETFGEPTNEKTYSVGEGSAKETHPNRDNPNFLDFRLFDQAAFQGISNPKAPEELKTIPVGRLAKIGLGNDIPGELTALNTERKGKNLGFVDLPTKAFLESWEDYVTSDSPTGARMMNQAAVKGWIGLENQAVRTTILAILNNDKSIVSDVEARADGMNSLFAMNLEAYGILKAPLDKLTTLTESQQKDYATQFAKLLEGVTAIVETSASETVASDVESATETDETVTTTAE